MERALDPSRIRKAPSIDTSTPEGIYNKAIFIVTEIYMDKFIPYEKLSKKEKRKLNLAKHQT